MERVVKRWVDAMSKGHAEPTRIVEIEGLLDAETCKALVRAIPEQGWREEQSRTRGPNLDVAEGGDPRQDAVADVYDPRLALRLYWRAQDHLPLQIDGHELFAIRPTLRLVRYREGQGTTAHRDCAVSGAAGERSRLTLLIYLNDDFEGGETQFVDGQTTVSPSVGKALLFAHGEMHRGDVVRDGTKYVLRCEVYYAPPSDAVAGVPRWRDKAAS